MPKEGRYELVQRLARVLNVSPRALAREVDERRLDPLTPITVKTSVGEEQVNYLYEHQAEFPGVEIVQVYLRDYTYGALAAQILGYTGEISPEELKRLRRDGYRAGDRIGKTGVEAAYDSYLRGRRGLAQIRVDSLGRPAVADRAAPGGARRATRFGSRSTCACSARPRRRSQYGIDLAHQNDHWAANGGAIVALDPRDGAVLAMASAPTYKPSVFVGPRRSEEARAAARRRGASANNPLLQPGDRRSLPAGIDVEAGDRARGHAGARLLGVRLAPVHAVRDLRARPADVPQLEPVREPPDDAARGARRVVRHVLLRDREPLLRARLREPRPHAAVGAPVRVRRPDRARHRRRGGRSPADARVAPEDVRERLGSRLEPGRLDPARDRPEGPPRHAAPDGRVLRDARERRQRRHAVPRLERRAAGRRRARRASSSAASRRRRRSRRASTRRRSRRSATACICATHSASGTSVGRLRQLLGADLGQDGNGREGRPAPRLSERPPRGPVVVVRLGAVGRRAARRLRADRERRPRLERSRARSAPRVRAVLRRRRRRRASWWTRTDDRGSPSTSARSGTPPAEPRPRRSRSSAASTGSCSRPRARSSATASGSSRASRASTCPGDESYFVVRQGDRGRASASSASIVAAVVPIDLARATGSSSTARRSRS